MTGAGLTAASQTGLAGYLGAGGALESAGGALTGAVGTGGAEALGIAGGGTALGVLGAAGGAFAGGDAAGNLLNEHTTIGQHVENADAGIDHFFDRISGGDGEHSALLRLDDYRQQQWDRGGAGGVAKSIGAGALEGLEGATVGIGGTLAGAAHWAGTSLYDAAAAPFNAAGEWLNNAEYSLEQGALESATDPF